MFHKFETDKQQTPMPVQTVSKTLTTYIKSIMKKLLLVGLAGLAILASCDKDEDVSSVKIVKDKAVFTDTTINMFVGDEISHIYVSPSPDDLTPNDYDCSWASSNPDVASTTAYGPVNSRYCTVTANNPGEAKITVTTDNGSSASFNVKVTEIAMTGVALSKESNELYERVSLQLELTTTPANASYKDMFTYKSSDESVATVDKNGKVTAVNPGKCEITVTNSIYNVSAKCNITVKKIEFAQSEVKIKVGEERSLDLNIFSGEKGTSWSTSDPKVATVTDGMIKGIGAGTCIITADNSSSEKEEWIVTVEE